MYIESANINKVMLYQMSFLRMNSYSNIGYCERQLKLISIVLLGLFQFLRLEIVQWKMKCIPIYPCTQNHTQIFFGIGDTHHKIL